MKPLTWIRISVLLIASLLSATFASWHLWQSGLKVNVPAFAFSPLLEFAMIIFTLSVIVYAIAALIGSKSRLIIRFLFLILAIAVPFTVVSVMPSHFDGFVNTIEQVPESEWHAFAKEATEKIDHLQETSAYYQFEHWNQPVIEELKPSFSFLKHGRRPPAMYSEKTHMRVWWGNGMVGSLEIQIWFVEPPTNVHNRPSIVSHYQIYDRVFALSRS